MNGESLQECTTHDSRIMSLNFIKSKERIYVETRELAWRLGAFATKELTWRLAAGLAYFIYLKQHNYLFGL